MSVTWMRHTKQTIPNRCRLGSMVRIATFALLLFNLTGCALLDKATDDPRVGDVVTKLKEAIQDIDPQGVVKAQLCERYMARGVVLAEAAWTYQWPSFAPLWDKPPDPAADLAYCRGLIVDAGATIVTKTSDSGSATAVCFQAQFPQDFGDKSIEEQAAVACHEAAHILEQKTVGCLDWVALYFVTISARMTFEGTAYVLAVALLRRYGWSEARARTWLTKRAERFPERYSIPREVITDECTLDYWLAIEGAFRKRTGR